jgi:hypothetical protein
MNIPECSTPLLMEFQRLIARCLSDDDRNPGPEKKFGVRGFRDWRQIADEIERELSKRGVTFEPIAW